MLQDNKIESSCEELRTVIANRNLFWASKRLFDIIISLLMLPFVIMMCAFLYLLNRYFNSGPVFFVQKRMGKDCKVFNAIKFRTMSHSNIIIRGHNDPVEENRITLLGGFLRNTKLDEIPQFINVLLGDMSLIGPRPDYYEHALIFLKEIKSYEARHVIRPGISGLSQIRLGYAVGLKATKNKAIVDQYYIRNAGFILDGKIFFGTLATIFFPK